MAEKFSLIYETKGEYRVKDVALPEKTTWAKSNKKPHAFNGGFGVKIHYIANGDKKEKIVTVPKDSEDISLEFYKM